MANKCKCGCGNEIKEGRSFFRGHNRKGTKRSAETLEKMRAAWANEEKKAAWKAAYKISHNTPEFKEALRKANKGKILKEEHRRKIGAGNKGKVRTDETKEKIRQHNKGLWVGEKNGSWKGGVSRAYKTGYNSIEYREWRTSVFKRDNYTCQDCGNKDVPYVTAHHIKSFAKHPDLRFDIDNGITLCETCHCKVDNYRAKFKKIKNS
jgi:hypothetical protein